MKRDAKNFNEQAPVQADGSPWELVAFAIFFVVIFTLLARSAHAETLMTRRQAMKLAAQDPNLAQNAADGATVDGPQSPNPLHVQPAPQQIPTGALPKASLNANVAEPDQGKRFEWGTKLTFDTSRTLQVDDPVSYEGAYILDSSITDKKTNLTYALRAGYSREYSYELQDGTDGDFMDPALKISKSWTEGKDFRSPIFDKITLGVGGVAGASHEAARDTFLGSVGPSFSVAKQIHNLHLGQGFGYSRKFYNYDIRDDGTVNAPDRFSSTTDVSYDITKDLSLALETILFYDINFQRTGQTTEWTTLEIDYTVSKLISTALGVVTKRGTISEDGTENNLKFYDAEVAQAYFDLVLSF